MIGASTTWPSCRCRGRTTVGDGRVGRHDRGWAPSRVGQIKSVAGVWAQTSVAGIFPLTRSERPVCCRDTSSVGDVARAMGGIHRCGHESVSDGQLRAGGNRGDQRQSHRDRIVPLELNGRFLRNGPNPVQAPEPSTYHWFTGDGMVHGIRLGDGKAEWYRNRWVRSAEVGPGLGGGAPTRSGP